MTSLPKWALGALAFLGLSFGLAAPAQAYHGHRGGISISFGDPYRGAYFSVPIGHRYHHRRHYRHYPYSNYGAGYPYGYYSGYGYRPYSHYVPRYRYRNSYGHHPHSFGPRYGWRDHGWRHRGHHRRH